MISSRRTESLISVIIPTHNMATYLGDAILSVTEGDFDEVEILVVDDGSTDDTRAVVESFTMQGETRYDPRVKYTYKPNGGKSSAVNVALRQAQGKYITILDADDKLSPNSLSSRYASAVSNAGTRAEMVIGGFEVFDGQEVSGYRKAPVTTDPKRLKKHFYFSYKTPFHLNACLICRETALATGLFDGRLRRCQDLDYALRLLNKNIEVAVVDDLVYRYRKHRSSLSARWNLRIQTIYYRSYVLRKNTRGPLKFVAAGVGAAMDVAKAVYELAGNYER